jgi:hypothetical protein
VVLIVPPPRASDGLLQATDCCEHRHDSLSDLIALNDGGEQITAEGRIGGATSTAQHFGHLQSMVRQIEGDGGRRPEPREMVVEGRRQGAVTGRAPRP